MLFTTNRAHLNYIRVKSGEAPYKVWDKETNQSKVIEGKVRLWKLTTFSVDLGENCGFINGRYWGDKMVSENIANCKWELRQHKYKKFDPIVGVDKEVSTNILELKDFENVVEFENEQEI